MLPPSVIMSPIDFSEHSGQALQTATELASALGSELCLVHVVPAIPKLPSPSTIFGEREYEEELHKDAEKRLNDLAKKVAERGVTAKSDRRHSERREHGTIADCRAQRHRSHHHRDSRDDWVAQAGVWLGYG